VVNASPVILLAKREGNVLLAVPILEELRSAGLRVGAGVSDAAVRLAGE
jgi:hypothetical protein